MTSDSTTPDRGGAAQGSVSGARRPTIYDIAQLAGVSPSTVSRALSRPGRISARTEERIHEAARTLDFRVNPVARALQTGRTQTLGLLVADITNPVFFNVARGSERAAAVQGYTLIIAESHESSEREIEAADRISRSVDGIVLVSTRLDDDEIRALDQRVPLVVLNRKVDGIDALVPDIRSGIDQAVAHLATLGHERIAYLSGPVQSWMSRARGAALFESAERRGIEVTRIAGEKPTRAAGAASLPRILASGETAVMAYNDLMAIGFMEAAREASLRVPDQLSVIGFDDIFGADFTSPPLSTVRTPLTKMGESAVERILARLASLANPSAGRLATELVIRRSTAPAR